MPHSPSRAGTALRAVPPPAKPPKKLGRRKTAAKRPSQSPGEALVVRPKQAARLANVSERTIWNWIADERLPTTRIGRLTLIPLPGLRALLGISETA